MFMLFSSVIVMDASIFLGVLRMRQWAGWRSLNIVFISFYNIIIWFVGYWNLCFNCHSFKKKWRFTLPGLNWKIIDLSLLFLGQLAYRLPHPPPSTVSYRVSNFTLLSWLCLIPKTHATVLQVCLHSITSDPCDHLTEAYKECCLSGDLQMIYLEGFLKTFPTPLTGVLHCQMHI